MCAYFWTSPVMTPPLALSFRSLNVSLRVLVLAGIEGAQPPPGDRGAATDALIP